MEQIVFNKGQRRKAKKIIAQAYRITPKRVDKAIRRGDPWALHALNGVMEQLAKAWGLV